MFIFKGKKELILVYTIYDNAVKQSLTNSNSLSKTPPTNHLLKYEYSSASHTVSTL